MCVCVQVRLNQKRAAGQMLKSARNKLEVFSANDCVRVPIPMPDRAKTDRRNLLVVITAFGDYAMFTIATIHGFLGSKFGLNQFKFCDQRLIRQAAIASSFGQRYSKPMYNGLVQRTSANARVLSSVHLSLSLSESKVRKSPYLNCEILYSQ